MTSPHSPPTETGASVDAPGSRPTSAGGGKHRLATVLIGALLALLGFGLAVQFRSNSSNDSLATAREDDLVRILDDQNSRIQRLQTQISDLQTARSKLSDTGNNIAAARQEAQRQADALALLTGTVAAHGPGISVRITDPAGGLKAEDLLDVVEELRGAGAEVIEFGGVRIGVNSAFVDSSAGPVLDGTPLRAPYEVLAIGDPKTMDTALNIPTGVVSVVRNAGGAATITESGSISMSAVRARPNPKYATPTHS
jgi:uncharacterized protein YlxW (UPF0749 family)